MKLQEGDYVKNLTEKQFNELVDMEKAEIRYQYFKGQTDQLVYNGDFLDFNDKYQPYITKLTFRQFKSRAKNTFSHG